MASTLGLEVTGVDTSPTAIAKAEHKASERGLTTRFRVLSRRSGSRSISIPGH
jgi:2-polyprenyl-3-methyl-5-hydroxy-6-metoxy-1,4-benzoquinol methylase